MAARGRGEAAARGSHPSKGPKPVITTVDAVGSTVAVVSLLGLIAIFFLRAGRMNARRADGVSDAGGIEGRAR